MTRTDRDPFAELAQFAAEFDPEPVVGDVWWLPRQHVGSLKHPPNDAFCLMVVAESDRNGNVALLHYVAGSTTSGGGVSIEVEPSRGGLAKRTRFRFYGSRALDPVTIKTDGEWRDRLPNDRLPEIEEAVRSSSLTALKKVLGG